MRYFILNFILIILPFSVFAEYGGFMVQFEMELKTGDKVQGYYYFIEHDFDSDSIEFPDYLLRILLEDQRYEEGSDSLFCYNYLLTYQYNLVDGEQNQVDSIYTLLEPKAFAANQIKSVRLLKTIYQSYISGVSSNLSTDDTLWTKMKPLSSHAYSGYLCYFQVFVHVKSDKVDLLLKRLEKAQKRIEKEYEWQESSSEEVYTNDKFDEELHEIIDEFENEKVVVITECTC